MNLSKKRQKYYASVQKIIQIWRSTGLKGVEKFLNDKKTIIDRDSFGKRIKNLLNKKLYNSTNLEIEYLSYRFKLNSYERNNRRDNPRNDGDKNIPDQTKGDKKDSSTRGKP